MNFKIFLTYACSALSAYAQASLQNPADTDTPPIIDGAVSANYRVVARDGNSKVWAQVTWETNLVTREVISKTNSYVELATGSAHLLNGQWIESSDQIRIADRGAQATNSQHQVAFLGNINMLRAVDLTLPEGDKHLAATIIGLAYEDKSTGKSVLIAELKDSFGQLLPSGNQVLYPDAFTDFEANAVKADVLYQNKISGLEQLIVIRQQLPAPSEWGLSDDSTVLQVITAFEGSPQPRIIERKIDGAIDQHLDFGIIQMGQGVAFALGNETNTIPVSKQWLTLDGRQCLIEQTPFNLLQPLLKDLPGPPGHAGLRASPDGIIHRVVSHRILPPCPLARTTAPSIKLARAEPRNRGVVIDWSAVVSQTDMTFQSDTTYYVSSNVTLSGKTTFEGGSVIKFTNDVNAQLFLSFGPTVCKAGPARMTILTSKDDNSCGDTISGSTGSPTNYNGATFLSEASVGPYRYMRFAYAGKAISGSTYGGVWHCQFLNCGTAIQIDDTDTDLHNVLFANCGTALAISYCGDVVRGEHVTADQITKLWQNSCGDSAKLTNSILTAIANLGTNVSLYNCTTNSSAAGIFQSVGAAGYYHIDGSTNRNAGLTNISPALAKDLKLITTYPPIILTNGITTDTTLSPQAQRDTDVPDLGYHYSPLDYVVNGISLTNTLTLTNGVVLATYGASTSYGISVSGSGKLISQGQPNCLNYIVRYNTVQEQSNTNWSSSTIGPSVKIGSANANTRCRFTGWSIPGGTGDHFNTIFDSTASSFMDCQFTGARVTIDPGLLSLTNCLFERTFVNFYDHLHTNQWYLYNNLFRGGTFSYRAKVPNTVLLVYDNLFDSSTIIEGSGSYAPTHGYNGYVTNKNRIVPNQSSDIILTNSPVYQTSWLGNYYYPTNDGLLSTLIDSGSRYATNATLYHYCTTTNQVKESSSTVDLGFHFVACDGNGNPIDTNGDGIPDYLADTNGNGIPEFGELPFGITIDNPRNGSLVP